MSSQLTAPLSWSFSASASGHVDVTTKIGEKKQVPIAVGQLHFDSRQAHPQQYSVALKIRQWYFFLERKEATPGGLASPGLPPSHDPWTLSAYQTVDDANSYYYCLGTLSSFSIVNHGKVLLNEVIERWPHIFNDDVAGKHHLVPLSDEVSEHNIQNSIIHISSLACHTTAAWSFTVDHLLRLTSSDDEVILAAQVTPNKPNLLMLKIGHWLIAVRDKGTVAGQNCEQKPRQTYVFNRHIPIDDELVPLLLKFITHFLFRVFYPDLPHEAKWEVSRVAV